MDVIYLNCVAFLSTIQRNRGRNLPPLSPTPVSPTPTSASEGMDPRWSSGNFSNNDQTSSSFIVSVPSKSTDIYPEIEMLTRKVNYVLALFLLYHYLVKQTSSRKMHQSSPQRTRAGHATTYQSINLISAL